MREPILSFDLAGIIPISKPKFPSADKISNGVYLGHSRNRNIPFFWNPDPELGMKNPHISVLGVSGSGKSCTIKMLLTGAYCFLDLEGILILDFKGEYSSLVENLGGKVVYFGSGGKINPFELAGVHLTDRINQVVEMFKVLNDWGPRQTNVFTNCLKKAYEEKGFIGNGPYPQDESAPKIKDIIHELEKLRDRSKSLDMKNRVDSLFEYLGRTVEGGSYDFWSSASSVRVSDLLTDLIDIDLSNVADIKAKEFVAWTLLQFIYAQLKGQSNLKVMIVLDECHRISKDKHSLPVKLLKEARSAGFMIVVGTQSPFDVDDEILSNSGTRIVHQMDKSNYVYEVSRTLDLSTREEQITKTLAIGECLIQINSEPTRPAIVKIDYEMIKDLEQLKTAKKNENLRVEQSEKVTFNSENTNELEMELLIDIVENPVSQVVKRYQRIGVNEYQGNNAQKNLLKKNLIKAVTLKNLDGRYWGKTLKLTEEGKQFLKQTGYEKLLEESKRAGGILHQHLIQQIEQLLKRKGLNSQREASLGEGKTADLVVEDKLIIEVETGESDVSANIEKFVQSKFEKALIVCENNSVKRRIENLVKECPREKDVKIIEITELPKIVEFLS